ncbi:MAG: VWA domain-containing protein [Pyrinomonadaceae bacterium]|nr:VWA domain-containing protein [Pyrinomonadaceae bacterium]
MKRIIRIHTKTQLTDESRLSEAIYRTILSRLGIMTVISLLVCFNAFSNAVKAQDTSDDAPIRVDTLIVTIPLTVADGKGRNVPGLKKENFSIFQNGEDQEIELFLNEEAPMNVAILLDTSYSTREVLDEIQDAAHDFIKILRPEDRALIVSFDNRTTFLSGLTSDRKALSKAINQARISPENGSDMPDAISSVVNNHFASLKGRKAIIVLTDGLVTGRVYTAQQTLETLQKADVILYPIIFSRNSSRRANLRTKQSSPFGILKILTEETAGRFYEKEAAKLKEAFQSIAEDLKNQYLLGFYPQEGETGKSLGHIRVAVDRKGFTVRAKKKLSF